MKLFTSCCFPFAKTIPIAIGIKSFFTMNTTFKKKFAVCISLLTANCLLPTFSFGEAPKMVFEQNKNQWPEQVKFQADIPGGKLFLEQNTFTYLFSENIDFHKFGRNADEKPLTIHYHAFKVNFQNSSADVEVSGNNRFSWHRNYYIGNDPSKWADNVPLYGQVYYKGLYENIDMQVYNAEQNLKYDIIVHPGGNPQNIKMKYDGPDEMHLEYGHLFIKTSVYDLIEQKPYAYQEINGVKTEVACSYILKNNTLSFSINSEYDHSLPLVIDPTLIAATYTGSTADNWGFTATYDVAGNIYTGGIAAAQGYPTTVGAWDATFNGGMPVSGTSWPFDISLTKFNPNGSAILFSTYYGGSLNEQPHSLMVNIADELYVVGRTNSTNFPTTAGAYDQSQNGGYDIIVGKFNSTGGLMASTYIGGTGDDCVNISTNWTTYSSIKYNYTDDGRSEIILDNNSDVYVAACTRSTNFPTTAGAADNTLGGTQDGVVFKMNSTLTTLASSTYLGGSADDAAYGLKLDNSNNIYVTGGTTSSNFPASAGTIHPTYQGGLADGYIAVFNNGCTSLLRATYLGTSAYDQTYLIEIDASGDLYVFGQTKGAYPVTAGAYSNPNSGQFIHKVSGLLNSTVFSTVVGTGGNAVNISPTAFLVDSCQSIYIAGWGRCSAFGHPAPATVAGMPTTANAQQLSTDGCDFYFMVLTPNAQSLWYATFYGENTATEPDHVDGGTSRFDKRAFIYESVCASCGGNQNFPTAAWAYSGNNNSNTPAVNCNNAVIKMDVQVKPVAVVAATTPTSGCAPLTVTFSNTGSVGAYFIWDFGDGSPIDTLLNPSHTYSTANTYTLTLFAIDSIGICGWIDTAIVIITVGSPPTLATSQTTILCNGGVASATVTATGGLNPLTYAWTTSPVQTTPTATGLPAGTYSVTVTDALGCSSVTSITITEPTLLTLTTSVTGASCGLSDGTATANAGGGTPGYTYAWSTSPVQTTPTATGLSASSYSVILTDANGCTQTASVNITTATGPTVTAAALTNVLCHGGNTGFASATPNGGTAPITYQWSPTNQTTQIASGLTAGNYTIIITDVNGCSATATVTITEPPAILSAATSGTIACNGGTTTATVTASGGTGTLTYSWNTSPVQTTTTATGLTQGNYTVTVTDANGCTKQSSVTISVPPPISLSTTSSGAGCGTNNTGVASAFAGGGTPPYTYAWSSGQTTSVISNLGGGTYSIVITDANGCASASAATIPTSVQPIADFSKDSSISCEGIAYMFTDLSSQGTSSSWTFGDGTGSALPNPIHVFPQSGTYIVTLIVSNPPCNDTALSTVVIGDMSAYVAMGAANIFTPNADGINDCFLPALIGFGADTLKHCMYLEVFDRWGIKMFESAPENTGTDASNCWDGTDQKNKKPCVDGTYYYIAKLGKTAINGFVTLARNKN